MPGMGPYEPIPGDNSGSTTDGRRLYHQRLALVAVGSAVMLLLVVMRGGEGPAPRSSLQGMWVDLAVVSLSRSLSCCCMAHLLYAPHQPSNQPSTENDNSNINGGPVLLQSSPPSPHQEPSALSPSPLELWRGGGWLLPTPLLPWGNKPTGHLAAPSSSSSSSSSSVNEEDGKGGGGRQQRHHNANGHGKPRHRHSGHPHGKKEKEEATETRLSSSFSVDAPAEEGDGQAACDIFIGVASRPGNVAERAAMRATWLGQMAAGEEFGGA